MPLLILLVLNIFFNNNFVINRDKRKHGVDESHWDIVNINNTESFKTVLKPLLRYGSVLEQRIRYFRPRDF